MQCEGLYHSSHLAAVPQKAVAHHQQCGVGVGLQAGRLKQVEKSGAWQPFLVDSRLLLVHDDDATCSLRKKDWWNVLAPVSASAKARCVRHLTYFPMMLDKPGLAKSYYRKRAPRFQQPKAHGDGVREVVQARWTGALSDSWPLHLHCLRSCPRRLSD